MKLGSFFRNAAVDRLKKDIGASDSLFVVQYLGLNSLKMSQLRSALRNGKSRLFVAKNSLMKIALKDSKIDGLDNLFEGPAALVFSDNDIASVSKVLFKFAQENEKFILRGAYYKGSLLKQKDIENIAKLPSKEVLMVQLVSILKSPLAGLVFTLGGLLNKLVIVLNQIKDKKRDSI
jgi:large subunit ribosomal protein L10